MPGPQAKQRASGIRLGLVCQRSPRTLPEGRSARHGQRCFQSALTEDNTARLTSNDSSDNTGSNGIGWPTSSSDQPTEEPSVLEPSFSRFSYVTWEALSSWFRQALGCSKRLPVRFRSRPPRPTHPSQVEGSVWHAEYRLRARFLGAKLQNTDTTRLRECK